MSKANVNQHGVEEFKRLIIKNGFPNFRTEGYFAMGSPSVEVWNHAKIKFPVKNQVHKGTQYYMKGALRFLHFTGLNAAFNIIKEKAIRMYTLESMNDRHELRSLEHLYQENSEYRLDTIKSQMFCLSMCEVRLESNLQSLSAWRQYGQNGNGVALVLRFNPRYKDNWLNYLLSKVHYEEKDKKVIEKITKKYGDFRKNFNVQNFDHFIYRFSCFHKAPIYRDEREVRLVYFNDLKESKSFVDKKSIFHDIDSIGKIREYRLMRFEDIPDKNFISQFPEAAKLFPYVTIEKIIFGHGLSKDQKGDFFQAVRPFFKNYRAKKINFEDSKITNYFK